MRSLLAVLAIAALSTGCAALKQATAPPPRSTAAGPEVASNPTAAQRVPSQSIATAGAGEEVVLGYHPQLGFVRGARHSVETLSSPLQSRPGVPDGVVEACRQAIQEAATPLGVSQVEAVSAGPAKRIRGGGIEAPLEVRILYARLTLYEVRQAVVTCRTDARGFVVETTA